MTKPNGNVWRSLLSLLLVGVIVFVASPLMSGGKQQKAKAASRASNYLLNGSFESATGGVPDNWTMVQTHVDLGATVLGGCVSVDTTDYTAIKADGVTQDLTTAQDAHSSFTSPAFSLHAINRSKHSVHAAAVRHLVKKFSYKNTKFEKKYYVL